MNIDIDKLKQDLIDYFGSAIGMFPMAVMNVVEIESADCDRLIEIARNNGFNLNNYVIEGNIRNFKLGLYKNI